MSGFVKNAMKLAMCKALRYPVVKHPQVRHMASMFSSPVFSPNSNLMCGCGAKHVHTRGEKELSEFLTEEITSERKLQKATSVPAELCGFEVKVKEAEVSLSKVAGGEKIVINFNVNHTVDSDVQAEIEPTMDKPEMGELKSRPQFEVEISKGKTVLCFTCSILSPSASNTFDQEQNDDLFTIDDIVMFEGDFDDTKYSVSAEVIDGTLYDLLMNYLEDKGVTNEFVDKLVDFSTAYEHSRYIKLLENIQTFLTK